MSGGSLDYAYYKVEDAAQTINSCRMATPLYKAFAKHLRHVAKALKEVEWVMSGDSSEGSEVESIKRVLKNWKKECMQALVEDIAKIRKELDELENEVQK